MGSEAAKMVLFYFVSKGEPECQYIETHPCPSVSAQEYVDTAQKVLLC